MSRRFKSSPATSKVALVTGVGKKRVGWHVAQALAELGYALVLPFRRSAAEVEQAAAELRQRGVIAQAVAANLTDEQAVKTLFAHTIEQFGRLDVLVNCAANWARRELETISAAQVREHFETNTLSTFLCCQHAGLAMVQQKSGGCIVNIGDWAIVRPYVGYAAYFPSKGALPTLTRTFAVELGTRNPAVRVNCLLPGPVLLPTDLPTEEREQAINATLVKREGKPEHIAKAVLFLIENDFVTGVSLPIDGGRSIFASDSVL